MSGMVRPWTALCAMAVAATLAACAPGGFGDSSGSGGGAAVTFRVAWPPAAGRTALSALSAGRYSPMTVPNGVFTMQIVISGGTPAMTAITQNFTVTPGSTGSGTVNNVPAGTGRLLQINGLNSNGATVYVGTSATLTLIAGQPADAGTIAMDASVSFAIALNGNLTDKTISTFLADATTGQLRPNGYTAPLAAYPADVAVHPSGNYVYVAFGNQVQAYTVNTATGQIVANGSAVFAGTVAQGIAVNPNGNYAYVANNSSNDLTVFSISPTTGILIVSTHSVPMPTNCAPYSIAVHPNGKWAYVSCNGTLNNVQRLGIDATGATLTLGSTAASTGTGPRQIAIHPNGKWGYVANFAGPSVTVFSIDQSSGDPGFVQNFTGGLAQPNGVKVDAGGKNLYVGDSPPQIVKRFGIGQTDGTLSAGNAFTFGHGSSGSGVWLDPTGQYAYAFDSFFPPSSSIVVSQIMVMTVDPATGDLTYVRSLASRPGGSEMVFVQPATSVGLAAKALYVVKQSGLIAEFSIDPALGTLSTGGTAGNSASTDIFPFGAAGDPYGRFAYVANLNSGDVSPYTLDPVTGALTTLTPVAADSSVAGNATGTQNVTVDPSGRFVYAANCTTNTVALLPINQNTGAPGGNTNYPGVSASGGCPLGLVVEPTGQFLYTADSNTGAIGVYKINAADGTLGTGAIGTTVGNLANVAVEPYGLFLYASSNNPPGIFMYPISPDTGLLGTQTPYLSGGGGQSVYAVAIDPTGRYLYAVNASAKQIVPFSIDATVGPTCCQSAPLGTLSALSGVAAGTFPVRVAIDPTSRFVYATDNSGNAIYVYAVASDGSLNSVNSVATGASSQPYGLFATGMLR